MTNFDYSEEHGHHGTDLTISFQEHLDMESEFPFSEEQLQEVKEWGGMDDRGTFYFAAEPQGEGSKIIRIYGLNGNRDWTWAQFAEEQESKGPERRKAS
jgi:hypothetical protein